MLEEKILNSDCKDIYLKIKDKLLNEYSLVIDSSENYVAFDFNNHSLFHMFWIVFDNERFVFFYRNTYKLSRYNNICSIELTSVNYEKIIEVINGLYDSALINGLTIEQFKHYFKDNTSYDKDLFEWFIKECIKNNFSFSRTSGHSGKIAFYGFNEILHSEFWLEYTKQNMFILSLERKIGNQLSNDKQTMLYELTNDNKNEISRLLQKIKMHEVYDEEDGIHRKFKYYYNLIKENYNNRKDRIEGFTVKYNLKENKLYIGEYYFKAQYEELNYYSDFCKYDLKTYYKSFNNHTYGDNYTIVFLLNKFKEYIEFVTRIEDYLKKYKNIVIPENYPILLYELNIEPRIIRQLNIKSIKGFLSISEYDMDRLRNIKQTTKAELIKKKNELLDKYNTLFFDIISEDYENEYFLKKYEAYIYSLNLPKNIEEVLSKNNILTVGQLKRLNEYDINNLKGITEIRADKIKKIKKGLANE